MAFAAPKRWSKYTTNINFFAKFCSKFITFQTFLQPLSTKNAENYYFDQRFGRAALKRWSKYTTAMRLGLLHFDSLLNFVLSLSSQDSSRASYKTENLYFVFCSDGQNEKYFLGHFKIWETARANLFEMRCCSLQIRKTI